MLNEPKSMAVIGAGTMGAGVAVVFAAAGWRTHVVARSQSTRAALPGRWAAALRNMEQPQSVAANCIVHDAIERLPWPEIELVIENVPEDLALKQRLFVELEGLARADTLLTSNSSSFSISKIGAGLRDPSRSAGLHFFMPAHIAPLVEVVGHAAADPAVLARLVELMRAVGKVPVLVKKDVPGFLANRLQHALMRECYNVLDMGLAGPEDIDAAVRYSFGFRFMAAGPMLQRDLAGVDVSLSAGSEIYPDLSTATKPPQIIADMVKAGHTGVKAKQGFWKWTDAQIASEQSRYDATLLKALKLLKEDAAGRG